MPDVPYVAVGWLFEDVYVAEYPGLLAVAIAMTGDRPDSEDLVQETMVKAFINWRKLRVFQRPRAWCHMVLVIALRSRWRRRAVERSRAAAPSSPATRPTSTPSQLTPITSTWRRSERRTVDPRS